MNGQDSIKCGGCQMYPSYFEKDYFVSTQCGHIFHFGCIKQWILENGMEAEDKALIQLQGIDPISVNDKPHSLKVAIVGESGCGKSTLLHTFAKGVFPLDITSTCGCDVCFKNIEVNGRVIKLSIWDCGGQDKFVSITPNFLRNVHGVLLVYDITNLDSFEKRSKWLHVIRNYAPIGIPAILLGNKSDLNESRKVSIDAAKNAAECSGMNFLESSAKEMHNIEAAFRLLIGTILEDCWKRSEDMNCVTNSLKLPLYSDSSNYSTTSKNRCGC